MLRSRLKQGIKKGLKKVLKVDISGPQPDYADLEPQHRGSTASPPVPDASPPPVLAEEPEPEAPVVEEAVEVAAAEEAAVEEAAAAVEEAAAAEEPAAEEPAAEEPAAEDAAAGSGMDETDDTAGEPLTMDAVQEILDDMVRPALQGDGGDISLIKIEEQNIYVKLVGACSTCPSSIMTMKMGVEALLKEEFPSMKELIQVED